MRKQSHRALVSSWAKANGRGLSSAQRTRLYELALKAVVLRTERTLGELTVRALLRRLLVVGRSENPLLAALHLEGSTLRFDFEAVAGPPPAAAGLDRAFLSLLSGLLTLIDNLTGGILTPALQTELRKVRRTKEEPPAQRLKKSRPPR